MKQVNGMIKTRLLHKIQSLNYLICILFIPIFSCDYSIDEQKTSQSILKGDHEHYSRVDDGHTHSLQELFSQRDCTDSLCGLKAIHLPLGWPTLAFRWAKIHANQVLPQIEIYTNEDIIYEGPIFPIWQENHSFIARIDLDPNTQYSIKIRTPIYHHYRYFSIQVLAYAPAKALHQAGQIIFPEESLLPVGSSTHNTHSFKTTIDQFSYNNQSLKIANQSQTSLIQKRYALRPDFVISREIWGARQADQICNTITPPYRMSIHHTASPSDDGDDPAARMREMQAFHMDVRGWCDLGYHFVVAQDGSIFEGRRGSNRPAAHVGGENAGNVGISLIGNFEEQILASTQFNALVQILSWAVQSYGIAIDRMSIKGHQEWPDQQTACPGADIIQRLTAILNATQEEVQGERFLDMGHFDQSLRLDLHLEEDFRGREQMNEQDYAMYDMLEDQSIDLEYRLDMKEHTSHQEFAGQMNETLDQQSGETVDPFEMVGSNSTTRDSDQSQDNAGCQQGYTFACDLNKVCYLFMIILIYCIRINKMKLLQS